MKLTEPRKSVSLVVDKPSVEAFLSSLSSSDDLGVDAERASGFRYSNRAYLIQFSNANQIFLVDPTELGEDEISSLAALANTRPWILHSATQDLPCLAELGFLPKELFDTELAARLCGIERFGLSSIALELLDFEMEKEHSASDWSIRPLTPEMLNYAALDVDILHELRAALLGRLRDLNRESWAAQEFQRLLHFRQKPTPKDPWRSLPGITKVKDERKLKVAASLHKRRDQLARARDVAPGRLIPDRSIMAVIDKIPKSKSELARNRDFQGRASRSLLDEWWQAIEESSDFEILEQDQDPNHIPNHRSWEKRFPEAHNRLVALREVQQLLAAELSISPEILLSPDTLRRVAFKPSSDVSEQLKSLGARGWQIEIVAEPMAKALQSLGD